MTKSRIVFLFASAAVVVPLLTSGLSLAWADDSDKPESKYKVLSIFTEVLGLVRQAYVEEPDLRVLMAGALSGATDALDPFSSYVPADQVDGFFENRGASRELAGMVVLKDRGVAWIVALDPGGPAAKAGLRRGDIVSELGGVSTRSMPNWRIHEILSQDAGSTVAVSVVRSSDDLDFDVVLTKEREPVGAGAGLDGYRYLRLQHVDRAALKAVRDELAVESELPLLLDVRGAVGGDPEAAYAIGALFAVGKLGELRARDEVLESFGNDVAVSYSGRVVLLQDRGTQGAGEVLSAVLRGRDQVTVLGEVTFGHAGRMGSESLSGGGMLVFTDAFYTGPDGEPIHEGLKPDLVVRRRFLADS